jgi:hypothetical protein
VDHLKVYMSEQVKAKVKLAAKEAGMSESRWSLTVLLNKINRIKKKEAAK